MAKFGVDGNGVIVTEVSLTKITPQFQLIVDDVINEVVGKFGGQLDGIYLYGSVVTGRAIPGQSDLDCILVFKEKSTLEAVEKIKNLESDLSTKYERTFRGIGLEFTHVSDVCSEKERYAGMCFMKHLCVCAYGNDLSRNIEGFKPSEKVAYGFNGDIRQSLQHLRSKVEKAVTDAEIKKISSSLGKKVIRTGFSLGLVC